MTTTTLEQQKKKFRDWYEAYLMPAEADWFKLDKDREYYHPDTNLVWQAWQAAIAALPLPVMPEQAEPVDYQIKYAYGDWQKPWTDATRQSCIEAGAEVRDLFAQDPSALLARIAHLEQEEECSEDVIKKFSTILADICLTLKGERTDGVHHSYHDLDELVTVLKLENELHKVKVAELEAENEALKLQMENLMGPK